MRGFPRLILRAWFASGFSGENGDARRPLSDELKKGLRGRIVDSKWLRCHVSLED